MIFGIDDAIVGGALALGGGVAGAMSQSATNAEMARQAELNRGFQSNEAARQRQWATEMRNTAWQHSVGDMKAAGINPMLAVSKGPTASPSGASAGSVGNVQMENAVGKGLATAVEMRRLKKELAETDSRVKLNSAAEAAKKVEAALTIQSGKESAARTAAIEAGLPALKEKGQYDLDKTKIDRELLPMDATLNRMNQATGVVKSVSDIVKPKVFLSLPKAVKGK